jgi:hypothetical protein
MLVAALLCLTTASHAVPQASPLFDSLVRTEKSIADAMAHGDGAALWQLRRTLNAAALMSDMSTTKPVAGDIPCLEARIALSALATAAITAIAADTVVTPDGTEARAAMRRDADEAAASYLSARRFCAGALKDAAKPAFSLPLRSALASNPVNLAAMTGPDATRAMVISLSRIVEAERLLSDGLAHKPLSPPNPDIASGVAALFAFGRAQAAIPDGSAALRPCRRLGGALFQLYDMAAASIDVRIAQGARFDASRWPDAAAAFDTARKDAALRKAACATALGVDGLKELLVPEGLLMKVTSP